MQFHEAVEEILGEINLNVYCERQQLCTIQIITDRNNAADIPTTY